MSELFSQLNVCKQMPEVKYLMQQGNTSNYLIVTNTSITVG